MADTIHPIAQAWADELLCYLHPDSPQGKARRAIREAHEAEMRWLRESLERDLAPEWLIALMLENWNA